MKVVVRLLPVVLLAAGLLPGCRTAPGPDAVSASSVALPPPPPPPPPQRFAVYGDCRSRPAKHKLVVAQMLKAAPEFTLQTGDLVGGDGSNRAEWQEAYQIIAPLRKLGPYYMAIGNHDRKNSNVAEELDLPVHGERCYYTFTVQRSRVVVLDSNTFRLEGEDQAQLDWFKKTLAAAQEPFVWVIVHHPLFTIGEYAPGDLTVRRRLWPILLKYRPSAVFTGHDHGYYRTIRDGLPCVVTAGGGAPLYDQDPSQAKPGDVFKKTLHFTMVQVEGDRATVRAIDETGQQVDQFEVPARQPAAVAAPAAGG
ncbi:MAG: metallophosphoesterase [Fimbriimonadaceae bacterium]|nr:metallophosphoesterase [Fimbriimonadaceae bacterium]